MYQTITYDASGNPLSYYNGTRYTFTWSEGRRLTSAAVSGKTYTYAYDSDGLRLIKTVDGVKHEYFYASGKLLRETYGNVTLDFLYNNNGYPYALNYTTGGTTTTYYYITNLQGDVLSLINASGSTVASYTYDPYGKILTATGTLANINPLRYRGYYYDSETSLYYLQSRYYDPTTCRFINADAYASTGQGILGYNMFAYCLNNPANTYDPSGRCTKLFGFKIFDCYSASCPDSECYNPNARRVALIYDSRFSGYLGLVASDHGFSHQGELLADNLSSTYKVETYGFETLDEFVEQWNSLEGEFEGIVILGHGYPGGMSCAGKSISNSSVEAYSFWDLKPVQADAVHLYICHGATLDDKGNSVAHIFYCLTGGRVLGVSNGKLSVSYFTGMPYPTEGGRWSITHGNTTTIFP